MCASRRSRPTSASAAAPRCASMCPSTATQTRRSRSSTRRSRTSATSSPRTPRRSSVPRCPTTSTWMRWASGWGVAVCRSRCRRTRSTRRASSTTSSSPSRRCSWQPLQRPQYTAATSPTSTAVGTSSRARWTTGRMQSGAKRPASPTSRRTTRARVRGGCARAGTTRWTRICTRACTAKTMTWISRSTKRYATGCWPRASTGCLRSTLRISLCGTRS